MKKKKYLKKGSNLTYLKTPQNPNIYGIIKKKDYKTQNEKFFKSNRNYRITGK